MEDQGTFLQGSLLSTAPRCTPLILFYMNGPPAVLHAWVAVQDPACSIHTEHVLDMVHGSSQMRLENFMSLTQSLIQPQTSMCWFENKYNCDRNHWLTGTPDNLVTWACPVRRYKSLPPILTCMSWVWIYRMRRDRRREKSIRREMQNSTNQHFSKDHNDVPLFFQKIIFKVKPKVHLKQRFG